MQYFYQYHLYCQDPSGHLHGYGASLATAREGHSWNIFRIEFLYIRGESSLIKFIYVWPAFRLQYRSEKCHIFRHSQSFGTRALFFPEDIFAWPNICRIKRHTKHNQQLWSRDKVLEKNCFRSHMIVVYRLVLFCLVIVWEMATNHCMHKCDVNSLPCENQQLSIYICLYFTIYIYLFYLNVYCHCDKGVSIS